jgi:hypothetical protein
MDVLLGKLQSALGTKQTSLVNTDFRTIDDTFELTYTQEMVEQALAQGFFGQPQRIKGLCAVDAKVSMPIIPTGTSTEPNVTDFLKCCGMSYALATSKHTFAPSSDVATDWKDMTLWKYTGSKVAGESLLTKAHSIMFDAELDFEIGKPAHATFTGKGVPDGTKPDAASYVSGSLSVLSGAVPAVVKSTAMTIAGYSLNILKANVKLGNEVQLIRSMSDESGYLQSMITGRKSTFTATVYEETPASKNVYDLFSAQTLGNFDLTFGTAGSRISIVSTGKSEIIDVKPGNDNGVSTWEISGAFVDNSWTLEINEA